VLTQSPSLDTVGVFGRTLEDTAMIGEVLMGYDSRDQATTPRAWERLREVMAQPPPVEPRLAFVRTPVWERAEETTKEAFRELISAVEERVDILELPKVFAEAHACHRMIMEAELAWNLEREYREGEKQMSPGLRETLERGQKVTALEYQGALAQVADFQDHLEEVFAEYDAILTPAAPGEAPQGLDTTGDPAFCTIWTLCGTPALSLPLLQGPANLPVGVQLVGAQNDDARLFRTANWLLRELWETPA